MSAARYQSHAIPQVGSHISAAMAAGCAGETRLNVGQPDIIRPAVAADRDGMAAAI
jgi:hypothetical protein